MPGAFYIVKIAQSYLQDEKEVVLAAVARSGSAIRFASAALRCGGLRAYVLELRPVAITRMSTNRDPYQQEARRFSPISLCA